MAAPHYDLTMWETHVTEEDCQIIIRTSTGKAFYCSFIPANFHQSPRTTALYFKCLQLLRSGEEELDDDFYIDDVFEWFSKSFEPLIFQLASDPIIFPSGKPTLADYLFAPTYCCTLDAIEDELKPRLDENPNHGWAPPLVPLESSFVEGLDGWTRSLDPSDVEIDYERPEHLLIVRPTRVRVINSQGKGMMCFFKRIHTSFGIRHWADELKTLKKMAEADIPPGALICPLYSVVRRGDDVAGMLFPWIEMKGVLTKAMASQVSPALRRQWAEQITSSLKIIHERGLIWGDAKAGNILIDKDDNAWIVDFGGSYTVGWVDKEKAGTIDGDKQGLGKILDILN
ncbi:hypothetical protein F4778DRAFT_390876 [Xylariomycetidae sp. FL2044]|nr:hypothetical protein F4778DRAFT_390876 [Xylariomycetidae sp. FL2044]